MAKNEKLKHWKLFKSIGFNRSKQTSKNYVSSVRKHRLKNLDRGVANNPDGFLQEAVNNQSSYIIYSQMLFSSEPFNF